MTDQKPEALRLATILDSLGWRSVDSELREASAMLRSQHAEIERLRAELEESEQKIRIWRATFLHAETERGAYKMECERLRAELAESATDLSRVLETVKYLAGIAERGEGRKIEESETVEQFVLGYVKKLEAELEALRKQEPVALSEMLADVREVFDASGSETPQVVRDVIEYVASWGMVYADKSRASGAQPAPSLCDRRCSEFQNAECPGDPGRPCCMEAQPAPSVPEGWKLVPIKPTDEMVATGLEDEGARVVDGKAFAAALYSAMLAAAPEAPKRKPLTDKQLREVLEGTNYMVRNAMHGPFWPELEQACRAVEDAHGIKE